MVYPYKFKRTSDSPSRLNQSRSLREAFQDVFTPDKVDIVFSGHNHYYYRTVRDGIFYITAAGGGAPMYETDTVDTDWIEGDVRSSEYHFCVCFLDERDLVIKVVSLDGTEIDSMTFLNVLPETTTTTSTSPTSPTSPTDSTSGTGGSLLDPLVITIVVIGGAAVVIIVIVLVIKKKT